MGSDLIEKVRQGIRNTGYPLELEAGAVARRLGWHVFHSVQYPDPDTGKMRELDLMVYKIVRGRRIELRISCKSSSNKQFVFFTRPRGHYPQASDLKFTPVSDNSDQRRRITRDLGVLRFFSEPREAVNYTVLMGDRLDREGKTLLHDALMSVVTSLHYRILPDSLLLDQRGTVYFFIVLLGGRMFDATYDDASGDTVVEEAEYVQWAGRFPMPSSYGALAIQNERGDAVPLENALYWFGPFVRVEFVKSSSFGAHLNHIESVFAALTDDAVQAFGREWSAANFPQIVGDPPTLAPLEAEDGEK